ncbi:MAG: hypothetical protein VW270_25735 [Candidatus Poseidoniales archaeon]
MAEALTLSRFNIPKRDTDHVDLFYNTNKGLQYCGDCSGLILPWFVEITDLIQENEPELAGTEELIQVIADSMDKTYGFGGFAHYPFSGIITLAGYYNSQDDDPDMEPLVSATYSNVTMRIYDYSIVSLVDSTHGHQKIARFD